MKYKHIPTGRIAISPDEYNPAKRGIFLSDYKIDGRLEYIQEWLIKDSKDWVEIIPPILFQSFDKLDVSAGDTIFTVNNAFGICETIVKELDIISYYTNNSLLKTFKSEENARTYIYENELRFSYKDMKDCFIYAVDLAPHGFTFENFISGVQLKNKHCNG